MFAQWERTLRAMSADLNVTGVVVRLNELAAPASPAAAGANACSRASLCE